MSRFLFIAAAATLTLAAQVHAQDPAAAPPGSEVRGNWLQADQTRQQAQERADLMFQRLDSNHDGALTRDEAQKAGPATGRGGARVDRMMERLFGEAQSVSQEQFQAQALTRFDRQDLNRNGVVTADERRQARAARQER